MEMETLEDLERVMRRYQGYELNGRRLELAEEILKSRSRSKSSARSSSKSRSRSNTERDSKSRSKSNSRSRSKSHEKEVDPEDQDIKRQRKRSHSGSSKNSRPHSRLSEKDSPTRKTQRISEDNDAVEVNEADNDEKGDPES